MACRRVLHLEGVTYDATSNWGVTFLIVLAVCTAFYVGGGVGFAHKTQGSDVAIHSHPHFAHWTQLRGLVVDGTIFAKAKIDEQRGASGEVLTEQLIDQDDGDSSAKQHVTVPELEDMHSDEEDGLVE